MDEQNNKKTGLVIFDLDGTLLNTIEDLGNAVNHTLKEHGLPCHNLIQYKKMVGHGMRNLITEALPTEFRKNDFIESFLKEFLIRYLNHIDECTVPYSGIVELISNLTSHGYKLAVASNKIQQGTEQLIRKFFPETEFIAICGNCPQFPLKPDAALVKYIMGKAGSEACDTIMVGDSGTDITTARNAGISVIAVSWGFRPIEDLSGADYVVDTPEQILSILLKR